MCGKFGVGLLSCALVLGWVWSRRSHFPLLLGSLLFQAPLMKEGLGGGRSQGCHGYLLAAKFQPGSTTFRHLFPSSSIDDEFKESAARCNNKLAYSV